MTRTGRFRASWLRPLLWTAYAALVLGALVWRIDAGGPSKAFEQRVQLPSCGTVEVGHRTAFEIPADPSTACFREAMDEGAAAELVVRQYSPEGTLTVSYYRSVPSESGIEIFEDATRDSFGSQEWAHVRCPVAWEFEPAAPWGDCEPVRAGPVAALLALGAGLLLPAVAGLLLLRTRARPTFLRIVAVSPPLVAAPVPGWWASGQPAIIMDAYLFGLLTGLLLVGAAWSASAREPQREPLVPR